MPIAGFRALVRRSGTTTPVLDEAMASVGGNAFRITNRAREVIDPSTATCFFRHGANIINTASIAGVDFQFGTVRLFGALAGAISFSGNFLPLNTAALSVISGTDFTLEDNTDLLDTTVMQVVPTGIRTKTPALRDASFSFDGIATASAYDSLRASLNGGVPVCIDFFFGSTGYESARGFFMLDSVNSSVMVDGLIQTSISGQISSQRAANGFHTGISWALTTYA